VPEQLCQVACKVAINLAQKPSERESIHRELHPSIPFPTSLPSVPSWPCHEALRFAIMTPRNLWPVDTVNQLKPLLAKYL
jgi:hypothetical protein